uniref:G protein-coupled receptor n=1 Tax=Panagrellus redivivus TaxID=6233 RepID=A0A7E4VE99_PANRE
MHANASQFVNKLSTVLIILATEAVLAVMGWLFIYDDVRRWQIITTVATQELARFPEPMNFAGPSSPFAIIGLVIDAIVTVISIASYTAIYLRMNQLNKSTCCLLSERQLYRRRQREFKLVVEFCISTALYLGLWFTIRVIMPYMQRDGNKNRTFLALLPLLQVFYAGSHATLYVVLFGRQKGKKTKSKTTLNPTTMAAPKKAVYRNIWDIFSRTGKIEPASPTIEIRCCQ